METESVNYVEISTVLQAEQGASALIVHGLDNETSNAKKLFNLFCLFGNVGKIVLHEPNQGSAIVQLGDSVRAQVCTQHLNNTPVGGNGQIQIAFCSQNLLGKLTNPFISFVDYSASKKNRFLSPTQAVKNHIQVPTNIFYFFNAPPGLKESDLLNSLNEKEVQPLAVRIYPMKTGQQASSGLIGFANVGDAVMAVMKCNNLAIQNEDTESRFIMKVIFHH